MSEQDMRTPEARAAYYQQCWTLAAAAGNEARKQNEALRAELEKFKANNRYQRGYHDGEQSKEAERKRMFLALQTAKHALEMIRRRIGPKGERLLEAGCSEVAQDALIQVDLDLAEGTDKADGVDRVDGPEAGEVALLRRCRDELKAALPVVDDADRDARMMGEREGLDAAAAVSWVAVAEAFQAQGQRIRAVLAELDGLLGEPKQDKSDGVDRVDGPEAGEVGA